MGSSASKSGTTETEEKTVDVKETRSIVTPADKDVDLPDQAAEAKVSNNTSVVGKKRKPGKRPKTKLHPVTQVDWKIIEPFLRAVLDNDTPLPEAKRALERHIYVIQLKESESVLKKGSPVDGVYFVTSGELRVMSESEDNTALYLIKPGQYCGDVEVLFKSSAATTVIASISSTLLFISASRLRSALPRFKKTKSEYCAQGCHVPADSGGCNVIWREKLLFAILSKIPLFESWSTGQLRKLVDQLPSFPLMIYPLESVVMMEGDKLQRVLVLVKGSLNVFSGGNLITTFMAYKLPFLIAEEDLFDDSGAPLTLVATEPCWVIRIEKEWIENAIKGEDDISEIWDQRISEWNERVMRRDHKLFRRFRSLLQVELIYKWLRESEHMAACPPSCVYALAHLAEPELVRKGRLAPRADEYLVLVIILESSGDERGFSSFNSASLYSHKHPWVSRERGTADIVLALWFDMNTVDNILRRYPGAQVVLDWTPQYKAE